MSWRYYCEIYRLLKNREKRCEKERERDRSREKEKEANQKQWYSHRPNILKFGETLGKELINIAPPRQKYIKEKSF